MAVLKLNIPCRSLSIRKLFVWQILSPILQALKFYATSVEHGAEILLLCYLGGTFKGHYEGAIYAKNTWESGEAYREVTYR